MSFLYTLSFTVLSKKILFDLSCTRDISAENFSWDENDWEIEKNQALPLIFKNFLESQNMKSCLSAILNFLSIDSIIRSEKLF